jgi:hypothetical protein
MPTPARFFGVIVFSLLCAPAIFAQTNPPPSDPHEMVTRQPHVLSKPADHSAAIDLLNRARENYNLRDISTPYTLKASFQTSGAAQNEGPGTMEEFSDGASHWRWSTQLQDSTIVRIGSDGHVYGTNASEPVPLRVQMVRSALHWPIMRNAGAFAIRSANVEHDGKSLSCLLLSGSIPVNPAPRSWVENEYCIDSATGFLQSWSEAPGIYAIYDYSGAREFHGHTLPTEIFMFEEGSLVVQAHLQSLEDAPDIDANLFKPTPEMVDAGESFMLATPNRFPMRVDPSDAPTSTSLFRAVGDLGRARQSPSGEKTVAFRELVFRPAIRQVDATKKGQLRGWRPLDCALLAWLETFFRPQARKGPLHSFHLEGSSRVRR